MHIDRLSDFASWMAEQGFISTLEQLAAAPSFLDECLREYGMQLYEGGFPMYLLVYTITAVQARFPYIRRALPVSWDLAHLWDQLEPVQHRRPVPVAVYRAMVTLALSWGWPRLAGILVLIFHNVLRPVEGFSAVRQNLVLPQDTLTDDIGEVIISIPRPKTRNRGARHQYARMDGRLEVAFISAIFGDLAPSARLIQITTGTFRRRWDRLALTLRLEHGTFTPGGLRGGGAIAHFRTHRDISLLMWQMRVRDQSTLSHYLQEATALTTMVDLPACAREAIRVAASLYEVSLSRHSQPASAP